MQKIHGLADSQVHRQLAVDLAVAVNGNHFHFRLR
jgi:hypothetical protein